MHCTVVLPTVKLPELDVNDPGNSSLPSAVPYLVTQLNTTLLDLLHSSDAQKEAC